MYYRGNACTFLYELNWIRSKITTFFELRLQIHRLNFTEIMMIDTFLTRYTIFYLIYLEYSIIIFFFFFSIYTGGSKMYRHRFDRITNEEVFNSIAIIQWISLRKCVSYSIIFTNI